MSEIYLLQLASQQAKWLSARQTMIAANISNASTPGYRAMDIQPFSDVLDQTRVTMVSTNPADIALDGNDFTAARTTESDPWDATLSGNSVNLEQELTKEGDTNRSYTLNTNIKRAFHQMLLSALK